MRETQDGSGGGTTSTKSSDKESGVFADVHGFIFAEVGVDRFAVGVSYSVSDMSTPEASGVDISLTE